MSLFIPITKVDSAKRLVYGTLTEEIPDKSGEIFDYETGKEAIKAWSDEIKETTGGKSLGNVRAMHDKVAAGKFTDISYDDDNKRIEGVAKIIDDDEWEKVKEGVYGGFSIGGGYAKRWTDPKDGAGVTRYTPTITEVSLVDNPCVPTATFEFIKQDGTKELRKFKHNEDNMKTAQEKAAENDKSLDAAAQAFVKGTATQEQIELLKNAPKDGKILGLTEEAKAMLLALFDKAADSVKPELVKDGKAVKPKAAPVQKWVANDGSQFDTKREAEIHNLTLEKQADLAPGISEMEGLLKAHKPKDKEEEEDLEDKEGDDDETKAKKKEKREEKAKKAKEEKEAAEKKEKAEKEEAEMAAKAAQDALDKAAKEKKEKEGDYGSKEDAGYADPGHQKDKKPRYPLKEKGEYSEEKIRAAWNYINKKKNADKYSAEDLKEIKDKIIAAWKKEIDKDGPPSAEDKSEKAQKLWKSFRAGELRKGLHEVSRLASLICELEYLHQYIEMEEEWEKDSESEQPKELKEDIASLCMTLRSMVDEETEELFQGDEEEEILEEALDEHDEEPLEMAAGLSGLIKFAKAENGRVQNKTLSKMLPALEKAGAKHSHDTKEKLMEIHKSAMDHAEHVEKCMKEMGIIEEDDGQDGKTNQKMSKVLDVLNQKSDEVLALTKVVAQANEALLNVVPVIKELQKKDKENCARIEHLERQPMPGKGNVRAVSKAQDNGDAGNGDAHSEYLKELDKMRPEDRSRELMKLALRMPVTVAP